MPALREILAHLFDCAADDLPLREECLRAAEDEIAGRPIAALREENDEPFDLTFSEALPVVSEARPKGDKYGWWRVRSDGRKFAIEYANCLAGEPTWAKVALIFED